MKGLVIWAQSSCRSMMAFYAEVARQAPFPVVITRWFYKKRVGEQDNRDKIGLCDSEFANVPVVDIGEDYDKGYQLILGHVGWHHVFAVYQNSRVYRKLIVKARELGCNVAIASEAPCNMFSGCKAVLKDVFLRTIIPIKVSSAIKASDFFLNYSGDDSRLAVKIGWPKAKIIAWGYYPPPLVGSKFVKRESNGPFQILSTGVLSKYRGADVLVKALRVLKDWGCNFTAVITQEGELLADLKRMRDRWRIPLEFTGFVNMTDLIGLYQSCSVYVGAGRSEPWGMRLNDALNCGSPLVVSTGMGGVKIVRDYGCGAIFNCGDERDLASKLRRLAEDVAYYNRCAESVKVAYEALSPMRKAREFISLLIDWEAGKI